MDKLKPCRDCGHEVSRGAKSCPQCGQKKPGKGFTERHPLVGFMAIGMTIYVVANVVSTTTTSSGGSTEMVEGRIARWAHVSVNVRRGRSTSDPIVAGLERGERVEVDSLVDGWFRVFRDGQVIGYSASSVLNEGPLPSPITASEPASPAQACVMMEPSVMFEGFNGEPTPAGLTVLYAVQNSVNESAWIAGVLADGRMALWLLQSTPPGYASVNEAAKSVSNFRATIFRDYSDNDAANAAVGCARRG